MPDMPYDLTRIVWRHTDSGQIIVEGIGMASNYGIATILDVIAMTEMFPELEFHREIYDRALRQWVRFDA